MAASEVSLVLPTVLFLVAAASIALNIRYSRALKRARGEFASERKRTELVIRATQTGIFDWDVASGRIDYSERFKEILGFPAHADLSDRAQHFDSVHPEDREKARQAFIAHLREGRDTGAENLHPPIEYRMRRADGDYAWVRGTGLSLRGPDGRTVRYIASIIDISERKRQELELQNQVKFVGDLFDSVPLSLAFRDMEGRFRLVNRTWEQYFGYTREQVHGKTFREISAIRGVDPAIAEPVSAEDRHALELGAGRSTEPRDIVFRGRHYLQTRTAMADAQGKLIGVLVTGQDRTDRIAMERDLETQRQRLELVVLASRAGIVDADPVRRTEWFSDRLKEMLGFPPGADTSATSFFSLIHPEDRQWITDAYVAHLKGTDPAMRDSLRLEYRLQRRDGSTFWVEGMGLSVRDGDGRAIRFLASITDVSERRKQEEALREQINLTRDLIRALPNPLFLKDDQFRFVDVNPAWEKVSAVPAERAIGRTIPEVYPPEYAGEFLAQDRALLAEPGGANSIEVSIPGRHGPRQYILTKRLLKREDGSLRGMVGSMTDITRLKRAEQVMRESEERVRFWLENIPIPIAIYDPEGAVQFLNSAFVATFGWSLEEMRGQRMPFVPENRKEQLAAVLHNLRTVGRDAFETERLTKDGRILDVYISTGMARAPDGTPRATMVSLTDVTERKRMESELRASREEAMQAAQAKAAFLAAMSHEIRTPLNGVLGMAGLLEGTKLTPEQREYVETIQVSGDALLDVINDVLDYSKIESGRMDLEQEPLEPVRAIEESLEILGARARAKGLELIAEAADGMPPWVLGDFSRLRQVLVNLVSNAVKFTEAGEVVVEARPAAPGMIEFSVRDTGIGIPPGRIASLFEAFTQVDASTTRKYGGTGLGLAISRRLVEFMGGTLRVESTPGRGSTFSFTVRAEPCAPLAEAPATAAGAGIAGKRLLVVDDNLTNLRILSRQLERWGAAQVAARSAADALDRLASDRAFDAALFDYHMPGMDGVMLTRELRRRGIRFPVVLLSSSMYRRAEEAEAELFAAQLLKPIRQHQLQAAIAAAITGRRFDPGLRRQAPAESGKLAQRLPLRILVADDVDVNRKLTVALLRNLGYAADAVDSGRAAVAAASGGSYDLVLMDVQMPDVDGLEATRQIRERVDGGGPRIVALTASAMAGDRERCLAAGMDDYLSKPIQPLALRAVLEKTPAARAPQGTGAIDWRRIDSLKPFDADGSMVAGAVAAFLADAPGRIKAIRAAHTAGDAAGVAQAAHALKGAAANIGAARLQELSQAIEGSARDGKLAAARKAVAALSRSLAEARVALTAGKKY